MIRGRTTYSNISEGEITGEGNSRDERLQVGMHFLSVHAEMQFYSGTIRHEDTLHKM